MRSTDAVPILAVTILIVGAALALGVFLGLKFARKQTMRTATRPSLRAVKRLGLTLAGISFVAFTVGLVLSLDHQPESYLLSLAVAAAWPGGYWLGRVAEARLAAKDVGVDIDG